ncbi:reverse transcriptase domain-containing protein [Tanacetum coccineum]
MSQCYKTNTHAPTKYAVEIGTYKISFIPRNAVKGQVLADFLSDAPEGEREDEYFQSPEVPPGIDDTEMWTLYTDGAASSKGSGAGLILTGPSGVEYAYALRLTFASTNNEAEYEALLAGLRIAQMMNVLRIEVKVDSKLVASQINGIYEASNDSMIKYLAKAREYISEFKTFSIENIPRGSNQKADVLSKLATVPFHNLTKEILVEVLNERSTEVQEVQTIVEEEGDNWMTPIIKYLEEGIIPSDSNEARALHAKAEVDKCDSCQIHAPIPRLPKTFMTSIMAPWPFYQWGMDILGPLTPARGGAKFVVVAIDYFTKWVEAKPLVKITGKEIIRFVMDNIICRYGLPRIIVTDNGAQLERREAAAIREARYKSKMEQYYNKKVRPAGFRPGEFVYRRNEASRVEDQGKLGPKWEGPYRVTEAFENGSYKLQTMEDKMVPRTWHAINLRKCYL